MTITSKVSKIIRQMTSLFLFILSAGIFHFAFQDFQILISLGPTLAIFRRSHVCLHYRSQAGNSVPITGSMITSG